MIEGMDLVLLLALGTWAALDATSVGQFMVSRPLVSGTLAGWVLGDPATGFAVGAVVEVAHLGDLPAGAVRFPEPGPAAVPAVTAAVLLGGGTGAMAVGAALGILWAHLGGESVVRLRIWNGRVVDPLTRPGAGTSALVRRHWACIGADALRGAWVVGSGLLVAVLLPAGLPASWGPGEAPWGLALLLIPGVLGGGLLLRRWAGGAPGVRRGVVLAGGVAIGAALGVAL